MKILLTGASGYIGGRLLTALLEKKYSVTILTRDASRLEGQKWIDKIDGIIEGDLLKRDNSWMEKVKNFDVAYYLVHSLYAGKNFHELDKQCATHFAEAVKGVKHVIYLGGLVPLCKDISEHLTSRAETGMILSQHLPVTEFRAGPIIGSGSAPFEMVRYLTERIPIMLTPKWINNKVQPIGIRDVISYLTEAAEKEPMGIVEIGSTPLTFKDMIHEYSKIRNLKRRIYPLPVLTPNLAAHWVGVITPIPNNIAIPLIEGIMRPLVSNTEKAQKYFPDIKPISYSEAVKLALIKTHEEIIETHWLRSMAEGNVYTLKDAHGLIQESCMMESLASPTEIFNSFTKVGGEHGWPTMEWAWRIRGWIDKLVGGPGLIRGRRTKEELLPGDAVDFWRVEKVIKDEELLLRSEMKLPGKAWLKFEVHPYKNGSIITQRAFFEPHGLGGLLYWYFLYPMHKIIFPRMLRNIVDKAELEHDKIFRKRSWDKK